MRRYRQGEPLLIPSRSLSTNLEYISMKYKLSPEKIFDEYLCLVQQLTPFPLFDCPSEYTWLVESSERPEVFHSKLFNEFLDTQYLPPLTEFGEDMLRDEIFSDVMPKPVGLPLHLVSGIGFDCSGRRSGTIFPPHNVTEVVDAILAKLENPKMRSRAVCEIIKAPDFAAGGTIITTSRELLKCYSTGQGSMVHKCDIHVEKDNCIHFSVLEPAFAALQLGFALAENKISGITKFITREDSILVTPAMGANLDQLIAKIFQLPGFTATINFDMTVVVNSEELRRWPINRILQSFITHRLDFLWRAHRCTKARVESLFVSELSEFRRKYGCPRRTRIEFLGE